MDNNIGKFENTYKIIELEKIVNENIQILKETKKGIDQRFGIIGEIICQKYYFADAKRNKISDYYYSIDSMEDGIHYIVTDLDFRHPIGFEDEDPSYIDEHTIGKFSNFHCGVVSIVDDKITEIIPTIYKDIIDSGDKTVIVSGDKEYEMGELKSEGKFGCINLDPDSQYYGWNIAPVIFDHLEYFEDDYAYASVNFKNEIIDGYLCKNIDINRYRNYVALYAQTINQKLSFNEYNFFLKQVLSELLIKEEDLPKFIENKNFESSNSKSYTKK